MIDYITAKFPCKHSVQEVNGLRNIFKRARVFNGYTSIEVKSADNGNSLVISGNPIKYFQGHNIFGSNDLHGLCVNLFKAIVGSLGILVSLENLGSVNRGEYTLSRVDLALNFRMRSNEDVSVLIREVEWHWRELGKNVSNYGDDTVYKDQHSKVITEKFYNKLKELKARPLPNNIPSREKLIRYAEKMLRAEFTLRSPALRMFKLIEGLAWITSTAKQTTLKLVKELQLDRQVNRVVLDKDYKKFTQKQQQIYRLWAQGNCLLSLYKKNTLARRRNELLGFGIDIGRPCPMERTIKASIRTLVCEKNVRTVPKFAKNEGLIYSPTLE